MVELTSLDSAVSIEQTVPSRIIRHGVLQIFFTRQSLFSFMQITLKKFLPLVRKLAAVAGIFLTGCSTAVYQVTKDASYTAKLENTAIIWYAKPEVKTVINRTASGYTPTITSDDRQVSRDQIEKLFKLFALHTPRKIADSLREAKVSIARDAGVASTVLRIEPVGAVTNCAPFSCSSSVALEVTVFDTTLGKRVWYGQFKVGAPIGGQISDEIVQNFANSLVSELQRSQLLR